MAMKKGGILKAQVEVASQDGESASPESGRVKTGRTRFSSAESETTSRQSAQERAREFVHTPDKKLVNIHQFYADIKTDYKPEPGVVFYDEDTEEEEEPQDEVGIPQGPEMMAQFQSQQEERPESVLTDVTVDGLGDQEIGDMPGVQVIPRYKSVMSLSTVEERLAPHDEATYENANNHGNNQEENGGSLQAEPRSFWTSGTVGFGMEDLTGGGFSTAVDEDVLEAAKMRIEAMTESHSIQTRIIMEKLRSIYMDGITNQASRNYSKAIRCFSKFIAIRPDSVAPYVNRAECFLHSADFQSAILNYKRALCLDPNNSTYYNRLAFIFYIQGQCLFDSQQYSNALEAFAQAAEMKPDTESYHTRSIACLAALGRHGECLVLVNKRLEQEKGNADLFVMRSRLHFMFKNVALCYYDLKDALDIDPDHSEAKQLMSDFKVEAQNCHTAAVHMSIHGRLRDALQKISQGLEYDPSQASFHLLRGALHRQLCDFSSAVDDYLLAMDKTNHDETSSIYQDTMRQLLLTYNDFAIECFKKGFYKEAIILLNKAVKGENREKGIYVNRGDCFFQLHDYQFALADYHQALELDPSDESIRSRISIIHNEYGTLEYQNKNYTESESRFTLAIRNHPKISHYYVSRARARYMLENHGGARVDIITALLLNANQDSAISLTSRLFPGKTTEEILASGAAQAVKNTLHHVLTSPSDRKLAALNAQGLSTKTTHRAERAAKEKYQLCIQEEITNRELAREKKMVKAAVKSALDERRTLRDNGPRLDLRITKSAQSPSPKSGWRTFSQGLSVRDAT